MSYYLSLNHGIGDDYEPQYWWGCGWELTDLAELLCNLGDGSSSFDAYVKIPVEPLRFLIDLSKQVQANPMFDYMERLYELSEDFYCEFENSLSIEMRTALRMSYHMSGLTPQQRSICTWIAEHDDWSPYKIVHGLARGVQQMLDDGVEFVYVHGG